MSDETKNTEIKINREGNFYKWNRIFDIESRVDVGSPSRGMSDGGMMPRIPGVNIGELLYMHAGKKVRIIVEVVEES